MNEELRNEIEQQAIEDEEDMMLFRNTMQQERDVRPEGGGPRMTSQRLKDEHQEKTRQSDLYDAQRMLHRDGKLNVNKELGTGRSELIDELRQQLSHVGEEDSSLCLFSKDKNKRESTKRSLIEDEVLRSYDMVHKQQEAFEQH